MNLCIMHLCSREQLDGRNNKMEMEQNQLINGTLDGGSGKM
jgi:hypothetical protein